MSDKVVVEVGKNYVRVVVGSIKGDYIYPVKWHEKNFNDPVIKEDTKVDDVFLQIQLREIFKGKEFPKNNVRVVLCGISNILIREIEVPIVKENQMYSLIRNEAKQYFPINLNNYVLDYKQLKVVSEGNTKKQKVLMVGVQRQIIEGLINAFRNAGIKIGKIDIEPNSVVNLLKLEKNIRGDDQTAPFLVANISRNGVSISVASEGKLLITKLFPIIQLEEMFSEKEGNEYEFSVIEDTIAESILKFYDFLRTREESIREVNKLYLTGEVCQHIDVSYIIQKRLNIEVELLGELKCVKSSKIQRGEILTYIAGISGIV
ncbi:pilus assembly protein PilM [Caldicellulosiruptor morganii]|uniref:Pilus assembly protein PilM n=1 Tax=Caldicellulosiruptor morganii TaxID=1387555 RepID=A0ABY7BQA8_9FIRM|nr:pilus assembly protein PilM [Caldicellulosiruptor morganii]WAM33196.1 pilus assembly protein PilM [Caldicellulosiruptor morganii]